MDHEDMSGSKSFTNKNVSLMQLVYGHSLPKSRSSINESLGSSGSEESEDDEEFFRPKGERVKVTDMHHYTTFYLDSKFYFLKVPLF